MLTTASLRKYKSTDAAREISDGQSGLRLLIHPRYSDAKGKPRDGARVWIMRFRRDGRPAKLTLGRVHLLEPDEPEPHAEPTIGGVLTLRAARRLAAQISQQRAQGVDVIGTYAATKSRNRAQAEEATENSFGKLAVEFIRDHKVRRWGTRPRRWRETATLLGLKWPRDCEDPTKTDPEIIRGGLAGGAWADKSIANVDGHDVYAVLIDAKKKGIAGLKRRNREESDNRARKMRGALSGFFKWAEEHRRVTTNPCLGGWKPRAPASRERVLSDEEIRRLWNATETVAEPVQALLRTMLLTGQRLNEVRGMRYDELSLDGTWTIPSDRTKNHRPHQLSLPPMLRDIIAKVPVIEGSEFVFVGATGTTPVTLGSKIKATLDEEMEIAPWRFHDLRRSAASGLQRLGVRSEVIERLLNHVSGVYGGVTGTYQRDPLTDEVTTALLRWAQHVSGLVTGDGAKVVPLR
jgi:integrase